MRAAYYASHAWTHTAHQQVRPAGLVVRHEHELGGWVVMAKGEGWVTHELPLLFVHCVQDNRTHTHAKKGTADAQQSCACVL